MASSAWGKMVVQGRLAYTEHYEWAHRSKRVFLVLRPPHARHKLHMPEGRVVLCRGDPAVLSLVMYDKPRTSTRWILYGFSHAEYIMMGPGWQDRLARVLEKHNLPKCRGVLDFVGNRPLPSTTGKDHEHALGM